MCKSACLWVHVSVHSGASECAGLGLGEVGAQGRQARVRRWRQRSQAWFWVVTGILK